MRGTFYVVGVGPGDPELMTLQAVRILRECSVIAIPISKKGLKEAIYEDAGETDVGNELSAGCASWQIVRRAVPEIMTKPRLYLPMPMVKDEEKLRRIHAEGAGAAAELLEQGRSVAFITLGDSGIYSTGSYLHGRLKERGYRTELICGIPSFCAAAARLDLPLAGNREEIHIIPASYSVEESLKLPGTKVLMKAGTKLPAIKKAVRESGGRLRMVERCGMDGEKVYDSAEEIPDDAGYFSVMIIKEEE